MGLQFALKHLATISRHKIEVTKNCFRAGLYWQGILHDLSKLSWTEFRTGVKYYQGNKSPNTMERLETGVSPAWLHHKGRNRHHFEYWIDYDLESPGEMVGCRMPYRYVAEMFCDRVAASKVYKGRDYNDSCPWQYYQPTRGCRYIHPETDQEITELLVMLRERGEEETFRYLRQELKRRKAARDNY